jgi:hypothetical protein
MGESHKLPSPVVVVCGTQTTMFEEVLMGLLRTEEIMERERRFPFEDESL